MDVRQVVKELIAVPEQSEQVASLYLDASRTDEHQRQAVRVFVDDHIRKALKAHTDPHARQRLSRTLTVVHDYVAGLLRQRVDQDATGIAVFACEPVGLFRVLTARVPFVPMEFHLGTRPNVVPFLRSYATVPPLIVMAIDSEGARLWELSHGVVDVERVIQQPFPGWHSRGGWSQRRYNHHLLQLRDRNLRAAAEPLERLAEVLPDAMIVLAGQHFILKQFEAHLPERVARRIAARLPYPTGLANGELRDSLVRAAMPHIDGAIRARHEAIREHVFAEIARGGLGVGGVEGVLLALAEGRLMRLLIDEGHRSTGSSCTRCGALGAKADAACAYCGAEVKQVQFPEELIRRAVLADVETVILPRELALNGEAGIAGQLRHRGAALAGAGEAELP